MVNGEPKAGLVLSGGGARGAYEAGIIYYLFVAGPKELREALGLASSQVHPSGLSQRRWWLDHPSARY